MSADWLLFTVVLLVAWPVNASEAGGDLAFIQTSLLFSFKCQLLSIGTTWFTQQEQWGLYQNKVTSSLAAIQRQVNEQTTVKWSIVVNFSSACCFICWPQVNFDFFATLSWQFLERTFESNSVAAVLLFLHHGITSAINSADLGWVLPDTLSVTGSVPPEMFPTPKWSPNPEMISKSTPKWSPVNLSNGDKTWDGGSLNDDNNNVDW